MLHSWKYEVVTQDIYIHTVLVKAVKYHLFLRIAHMARSNINVTLICHRYIVVTLEIYYC